MRANFEAIKVYPLQWVQGVAEHIFRMLVTTPRGDGVIDGSLYLPTIDSLQLEDAGTGLRRTLGNFGFRKGYCQLRSTLTSGRSYKRQWRHYARWKRLTCIVTVANMNDGKAAIALFKQSPKPWFKRWKRIWADGGYRGEFVEWVGTKFKKFIVDITF